MIKKELIKEALPVEPIQEIKITPKKTRGRGRPFTNFSKNLDKMNREQEEEENEDRNLLDVLGVEDGKNKIEVKLLKNDDNRTIRLDIYLNNSIIKPTTFNSLSAATNFWSLFSKTFK